MALLMETVVDSNFEDLQKTLACEALEAMHIHLVW